MLRRYTNLFSPEVRGLENLPATGPVLVVGNHSGLFYMPDAWVVSLAIVDRRGSEQPAYALGYDLLFGIPGVGRYLRRIGAIPARGGVALEALGQGALVLDYPGGDLEACRPWTARNRIDFAGRTGFVRLALQAGVPVVPVVSQGGHDIVIVVTRGERLARVLGLHRLRIKVFPVMIGPPMGLATILNPPLPLPAAITVEFLPALDWTADGPDAAGDPGVVASRFREITGVMQEALDRLHLEHPHPVARGVSQLVRRTLTRGGPPVQPEEFSFQS